MKKIKMFLLIVVICLLSSCKKKQEEPQPDELTPLNAAGKYGQVMVKTKQRTESMNLVMPVKQLIDSYWAEEGKYPSSLQELVTSGYTQKLPEPPEGTEFTYNPSTGSVGIKDIE
ncbi:hypothetical protein M0P98_09275 [bacterium]|nr:hypothetical protein [bacterium]